MDDLLLFAAELVQSAFRFVRSSSTLGVGAAFVERASEREALLSSLKTRSRVLAQYAQSIRAQLSRTDTADLVGRAHTLLV